MTDHKHLTILDYLGTQRQHDCCLGPLTEAKPNTLAEAKPDPLSDMQGVSKPPPAFCLPSYMQGVPTPPHCMQMHPNLAEGRRHRTSCHRALSRRPTRALPRMLNRALLRRPPGPLSEAKPIPLVVMLSPVYPLLFGFDGLGWGVGPSQGLGSGGGRGGFRKFRGLGPLIGKARTDPGARDGGFQDTGCQGSPQGTPA